MTNPVKLLLGKLTGLLLKAFRLDLLTKEDTVAYLNTFQIDNNSPTCTELPDVHNQSDDDRLIFSRMDALTHSAYVWNFDHSPAKTCQLPYGSIQTDGKILSTDFETYHLLRNFVGSKKRTTVTYDTLLAPWSHFTDGLIFGGYYDFTLLVAAKLCRMKEALLPDVFAETVVAYPLFGTGYERELLGLIGFTPDRIFDSRAYDVRFKRSILGNSGHWFYPHPADIRALKKHVEKEVFLPSSDRKRIYVSRAGRRRIINETSLITLLKSMISPLSRTNPARWPSR